MTIYKGTEILSFYLFYKAQTRLKILKKAETSELSILKLRVNKQPKAKIIILELDFKQVADFYLCPSCLWLRRLCL